VAKGDKKNCGISHTVVFPKQGQMRFADAAGRSKKFPIFWATDHIIILLLDLDGYLRKLALRFTWPPFGNTTVLYSQQSLPPKIFVGATMQAFKPCFS
jgi:hypothetical protein